MRGLMVAITDEHWEQQFGNRTGRQMANVLLTLAKRVDVEAFRKDRRSPNKPQPNGTKFSDKTHVSTARILAASRGKELRLLCQLHRGA